MKGRCRLVLKPIFGFFFGLGPMLKSLIQYSILTKNALDNKFIPPSPVAWCVTRTTVDTT